MTTQDPNLLRVMLAEEEDARKIEQQRRIIADQTLAEVLEGLEDLAHTLSTESPPKDDLHDIVDMLIHRVKEALESE